MMLTNYDSFSSAFYRARPTLNRDGEFLVAHFAGPVTYQVDGFILKNTDALQADLVALVTTPRLFFVLPKLNSLSYCRDNEDIDFCGAVLRAGMPSQVRFIALAKELTLGCHPFSLETKTTTVGALPAWTRSETASARNSPLSSRHVAFPTWLP